MPMPAEKSCSLLYRRVLSFIKEHSLFAPGEKVVLGFSGGPDSMALLHILAGLNKSRALRLELVLAHMNHSLRGSCADADQQFCRETAKKFGFKFVSSTVSVREKRKKGESLEQAGRRLRYDFLHEAAKNEGAKKVAVAHHADDVAETLVLRMLRGCGLYGLAGMAPARLLKRGSDVVLTRPLLDVRKNDIIAYLEAVRAGYRIDNSNADPAYLRNYLRIKLIPELEFSCKGSFTERLSEINRLANEVRTHNETRVESVWDELVCGTCKDGLSLSAEAMAACSRSLRTALFRRAICRLAGFPDSVPDLKRDHWTELDSLLFHEPGRSVSLPGGLRARREHGSIFLFGERAEKKWGETELIIPGRSGQVAGGVRITASMIRVSAGQNATRLVDSGNRQVAHLAPEKVDMPLKVRTRRPGDRFRPLGSPGSCKLKKFFIDRKIPLRDRDSTALVLDRQGRIIWVAGFEIADFCKLTGEEEKVLEFSIE